MTWTKETVNDRGAETTQNKLFYRRDKAGAALAVFTQGGNQLLVISGAHGDLLSGVA